MHARILKGLIQLESDENIKIIYAAESGSRAWGFPSEDSDYDVRFLYARPVKWYLSIDEKRDVVERPVEAGLDFSGWDLKKALALYRKPNPPLLEWLGSPIVYLERGTVAQHLRDLLPIYYSPTSCMYHCLHMARGNFREYLRGEQVWVKKYFYLLRPILAVNWIEQGLGIVPTDFNVMVNRLVRNQELHDAIEKLLTEKRSGAELHYGARIPVISDFIESEFARCENFEIPRESREFPFKPLNEIFRQGIHDAWHA